MHIFVGLPNCHKTAAEEEEESHYVLKHNPKIKGRRIRAYVKMASPKTVPKDAQVNNALETVLSPCCATFILLKP